MRRLSTQVDKLRNCIKKTTTGRKICNGHIVIVEGNIGVGKTTLTCQLEQKLNYRIFLEPTSANPYLNKFYQKPKEYALKMQLWLFKQRCMTYMEALRHWMESGWYKLTSLCD